MRFPNRGLIRKDGPLFGKFLHPSYHTPLSDDTINKINLILIYVRFNLVVNQHPERGPRGDHWEISSTLGFITVSIPPDVKSDNPREGILEKFGVQGWLIN